MDLVVSPPVPPMLAKRVDEIPSGSNWSFEPKWDGFRTIVFRDGDEILLQSRDLKPLNRYFPELLDPVRKQLPKQCVVDGEIVIATGHGLDFDALQLRLHPAESRVRMLAEQTPSSIVLFDLLCEGTRDLRDIPFEERRERLQRVLSDAAAPVHITPSTRDRDVAQDWFRRFEGAGLDGVIAKPAFGVYEPDKRSMLKVKHERDCDCVVAGFRWHKNGEEEAVGSLLLGLYDASEDLQHVGVCASFTQVKRRELKSFLEPYRENALRGHPWSTRAAGAGQRLPGGQSRWSQGKDLSWVPLRAELVVEVAYEHMQGDRFRHMAQFRRWRKDKRAEDCTFAQLEIVPPQELDEIFRQQLRSAAGQ